MDFTTSKSQYSLTSNDDLNDGPSRDIELVPMRSISSFKSSKSDQRLLNYSADYHLVDGIRDAPKRTKVGWRARFEGWRAGALTAAAFALLSLLINLAVVIWLGTKERSGSLVPIYVGSCSTVNKADVWIHLAINVLSTLLLGGSNYCMQCASAPTRAAINKRHAVGKYLDVGVPSVRNLAAIPPSKKLLWWALALSSVPLHLMYNSAFVSLFPLTLTVWSSCCEMQVTRSDARTVQIAIGQRF
jgi:hypothetical protein